MTQSHSPPALAGRYELGEVLGRGGMADVYRAVDRLLDREVAVKVLRGGPDEETDRARFAAEARTLAQLSHSGLVMVLDAGMGAGEDTYLVMELVEGPTLAQLLESGPLLPERAGAIGVQLAEALAYAHDRGVVHRDIKPANVLLGADERVKLADFGIARLIGDTVRHTRPGQAIGTAAYLAPEQVTGQPVDGAADIYALGLVLLEAVTGERAFPGPPTEAAMARLTRQPEIPADLPGHWRDTLTEMTAREPGDRPSAADVAIRLRTEPTGPIPMATVRDLPVSPDTRPLTSPPPVEYVTEMPMRRWLDSAARRARTTPAHLLGAGAAIAALVVLIVVVAIAGQQSGGETDDLPADTPSDLRQPLSDLHDAVNGG